MHFKAYQVDGRFLRTGSANFSFSGSRRQDNDIIVLESTEAVGAFALKFQQIWTRRDNDPFRP
jgi:phosphatidylserine/phosphatidylglycerophosphate/cardiolipin synthase-like enzyme